MDLGNEVVVMMFRNLLIGLSGLLAIAPMQNAAAHDATWEVQPVSDEILSQTVGTASPTTRLSVIVSAQGAILQQQTAENLRIGFDNWFADNNLQQVTNMAFHGGVTR